ncbi:MAG TPA: hypothetical protein VJR29_10440 [bacterium]|nr:hypothetical protein [bacterium]
MSPIRLGPTSPAARQSPPTLVFSELLLAESYFAVPLENRPRDAATLASALENFRHAGSRSEHRGYLRQLAADVAEQVSDLPSLEERLARRRLLAEAFAVSDRRALLDELSIWLDELASHPIAVEARIADLGRIAELIEAQDIGELRPRLGEAVQAQVDEWRNLPQGRRWAFALLQGTWRALGEAGRGLHQDLLDELDRDVRLLEQQARDASPQARMAAWGEAAALYRQLSRHPEAGEHYLERWRETLNEILQASEAEDFPPSLRLEVQRQVLSELESGGELERAQALRESMAARAERSLSQGRNVGGAAADRYQALLEAHGTFQGLGDGAGADRAEASLRRFLAELEHRAGERENPELGREVAALALEAFLQLEDWDAAELRLEAMREMPEPPHEPNASEPAATPDPRAQWLLRLGGYAQRIAVARSELAGQPADFSRFGEILGELSALGARTGQATMALYGRWMRALLDQDPAAEGIYRELQAWRPPEIAVWEGTPDFFIPEEVRNHPADAFQRMATEIAAAQAPMTTLSRAGATLQFLSLAIEGNYQARCGAAEAAGHSTLPIREERDRMRRYLSHLQAILVSGRAGNTREAIELLPQAVGNEGAAREFYRSLERTFASTRLDGREVGAGALLSRLIDCEGIADLEVRGQARLSLAREMIVADSINHRADALIGSLLEAAEQSGARGRAPRPLLEILGSLSRQSRDLDDFAELHNRLAGNETLRQQIQATRDAGLYVQTMNQVVDSVFSVEGGAIMLASIFTAGLAAELAGAAMLARLGSGALTVAGGVARMTWAARLTVGATRLGAAWVARSATELGGIAAYRAFTGRRPMSFEEVRVRLITSLFCSIGDEFATHLTRSLLGRALGQGHALTEVAEFLASGLGEMWGEEVGARVAGRAADTRPFLVRYFEETLHGSFFVAGTRTAAPLAALARSDWRSGALPPWLRISAGASLLGLSQAFDPEHALASVGNVLPAAGENGSWLGGALALLSLGALAMAGSRRRNPPAEAPSFFLLEEWLESAAILAVNSPELEDFTRDLGQAWENREISFPTMLERLRAYIREETPVEGRPGLLASLAAVFARGDLIVAAHHILEEENLSLSEVFPDLPDVWHSEEDLARVQLVQALAGQGLFEGEISPVYHLAKIRHSGARLLAWRSLLTALVARGQWQRAQDLLTSFERNPRLGTPLEERPALRQLLLEIIQECAPRRGPGGNNGGMIAALLAASAGAAAWLSPALAQAQATATDPAGDWGGWLLVGGALAAGGYFLYRHSHPVRMRALRSRLDSLAEDSSAEARREAADWFFEERQADPEHFVDGAAYRSLLSRIRGGSLAALDVYLRLLEREDPVARQLLSAADRRACERLILRQLIGGRGLERLIHATLDARLSVDLMDELVQRLHRPPVFTRVRDGIRNGSYREAEILLRAMERSDPNQHETVEDMVHLLQNLERRNFFHVRKFLERVRSRPELAGWLNPRSLTALLAAGAGAATWLSAGLAEASVGMAAQPDGPGWLTGAALLGSGLLAAISGGSSNPPSGRSLQALARGLFTAGRLNWAEENLRDRFLLRFMGLSPLEKSAQMAELHGALRELAAAGTPLSIQPDFLIALLRDKDPRWALEFFNALSGLGEATLSQGTPLSFLAKGLQRRGVAEESMPVLRPLQGEEIRTPAWLRFRAVIEDFSANLEPKPAELPLRQVLPIHYLDNHAQGDGAAALNGVRRSILRRLYFQYWRPDRSPSFQELAVALLDEQNHLPLVSRPDSQGRRLLLNGHHRIAALLSLVADGILPEEVLTRIPFHRDRDLDPEALIHRAFAGGTLPNPRSGVGWRQLLGFDEPSRVFLERRSIDQDLVAWIREVRTAPTSGRPRRSPRGR